MLSVISKSLKLTQSALKGLVLKTAQTEEIRSCMKMNTVPTFWTSAAWPSIMPLSNWMQDVIRRHAFISEWVAQGKVEVVWFSGFFYPQAFITGTL